MNTSSRSTDVLIIGGGPAGTTAGTLLARRGHRVVLLEKERFPRDVVGESLLPFCYKVFDDLGVLEQMKRRFVRKPGVRFIDRDGSRFTNWCFRRIIHDETYLSFHVRRSEFDQILLDNARLNGVEVHEETLVDEVDLDADGSVEVRSVNSSGAHERYRCRFLIDASGRDTFLGRRMGWKIPNPELLRTALWSHWEGGELQGGLEEGLSVICYIGQEKRGWIWIFPLADDRLTIGTVMDNAFLRGEKSRLTEAGSEDWMTDLYLQEIQSSSFVARLIRGARRVLPVQANGNYSYKIERQYGPRYAMVGDARGFIDPIFSSGVFLSMKSSTLLAGAVDLFLTTGDAADRMEEIYRQINGAYQFVYRMISMFYNPHTINWAQMGTAEEVLHKSHEYAMAAGHYLLSGDFFESQEKYNRFFQTLEDPRNFKNYYKVVLNKQQESWQEPCSGFTKEVSLPQ